MAKGLALVLEIKNGLNGLSCERNAPVPQGDNSICERAGVLLGPGTCESEIGQLQHTLIVYQQVRALGKAIHRAKGFRVSVCSFSYLYAELNWYSIAAFIGYS